MLCHCFSHRRGLLSLHSQLLLFHKLDGGLIRGDWRGWLDWFVARDYLLGGGIFNVASFVDE